VRAGTGAHGHAVEADLLAAGITLEMADRDVLVPMVTLSDDELSVARLVDTLAAAIGRHRGEPRKTVPAAAWTVEPATATDPRSAFFARHETVSAAAAMGRVSAELIAPYPPGVPLSGCQDGDARRGDLRGRAQRTPGYARRRRSHRLRGRSNPDYHPGHRPLTPRRRARQATAPRRACACHGPCNKTVISVTKWRLTFQLVSAKLRASELPLWHC